MNDLDKNKVGAIRAGAAVCHLNPGPSSMAVWSDNILEPGSFVVNSVARAPKYHEG